MPLRSDFLSDLKERDIFCIVHMGYTISSVFCSALGQPLKISSKKISTIPLIPIFNNF